MDELTDRATLPLNRATLTALGGVAKPAYRPTDLTPGIVHFGVGNFHRAHQAVYLDDLFNLGADLDWGIVGAGVLAFDESVRKALSAQDWLSTIVEQDSAGASARIIAPLVGFVSPSDRAALTSRLADPRIRIVSLTITEGGYMIDPATGAFDPEHPAIRRDAENPADPHSVFGLLLSGLARRRRAGIPPFTVLSCDNVPHNGDVASNAVAGLAEIIDPALAAFVRAEVAFPNSMVDRITPATTEREREIVKKEFGIEDRWPVFCERFRQWVLEDRFTSGRPQLEKAGVQFVADVTPFEHMKIRILNGGHAAIAYPAGLMGVHFVHEAMEHSLIRQFLEKVEKEEMLPTVPPVPGTDLTAYLAQVIERFANRRIGDTVRRLCFDGSNRQPKFIVPAIAERLARGAPIDGLALVSALWCRYCQGETDARVTIEPNDPNWEKLSKLAQAARSDPVAWLSQREIYGDVGASERFRGQFGQWLRMLGEIGAERSIGAYVARG
jgi:mannitol 2-dehydrogenase